MSNDVLLETLGLTLKRRGTFILQDVNLVVFKRETHILLGPNGSGKSSLAYTLMGCAGYEPDGGVVIFNGEDITNASIEERARRGLTLAWQEPARFEGIAVADYLTLSRPEASHDEVVEALNAVSLSPAAYMHRTVSKELSGGERKRIELAAVYLMHPHLVILDEPDSGIDVHGVRWVKQLIHRMTREGMAVLLITHRDDMGDVADRASLMCQGGLIQTGDPERVCSGFKRRCIPHVSRMGDQPWPAEAVGQYGDEQR